MICDKIRVATIAGGFRAEAFGYRCTPVLWIALSGWLAPSGFDGV